MISGPHTKIVISPDQLAAEAFLAFFNETPHTLS